MGYSEIKILSHEPLSTHNLNRYQELRKKIIQLGDKLHVNVKTQLNILRNLNEFSLGKYLIQNGGVNGYWTNYILSYPNLKFKNRKLPVLEKFLLEKAPIILATQERYKIFLKENQEQVADNSILASVPCGLLGELLYLNLDNYKSVKLVGIDLDNKAIIETKKLANSLGVANSLKLINQDAWNMDVSNKYNLISSNGLTIYEPNNIRVENLFKIFFQSLKKEGKLVTSFITYPPGGQNKCEWDFNYINKDDLLLQKIIFNDILDIKWQCYRSKNEILDMLSRVGFKKIRIVNDKAKIFPTIVGYKIK